MVSIHSVHVANRSHLTNFLFSSGHKLALKSLRQGQSKLLIIANNCPAIRKANLEYMAVLGNSKVLHFEGNNFELGKFAVFYLSTKQANAPI